MFHYQNLSYDKLPLWRHGRCWWNKWNAEWLVFNKHHRKFSLEFDRSWIGNWLWGGNIEKPTLTPSIQCLTPCRWHGYLTNGVFKSV